MESYNCACGKEIQSKYLIKHYTTQYHNRYLETGKCLLSIIDTNYPTSNWRRYKVTMSRNYAK
jgi:hypothetical protein